jgi:hypothetical protein
MLEIGGAFLGVKQTSLARLYIYTVYIYNIEYIYINIYIYFILYTIYVDIVNKRKQQIKSFPYVFRPRDRPAWAAWARIAMHIAGLGCQ